MTANRGRSSIGFYGIVPRSIFDRLFGDTTAQALYALLATYANGDNVAWPSQVTLAETMAVNETTIRRAMNRLEKSGLLIKRPRLSNGRKVGNEYVVVTPDGPGADARSVGADGPGADARYRPGTDARSSCAREPFLEIEQIIEQGAASPPPDEARTLVERVWERKKPKPAQPFVAIVKIARKLLDAGHSPTAIENAMIRVPTISVGWCEGALNKRADGNAATQRAQNTMDRIDEFFAKENE